MPADHNKPIMPRCGDCIFFMVDTDEAGGKCLRRSNNFQTFHTSFCGDGMWKNPDKSLRGCLWDFGTMYYYYNKHSDA